MKRMKKKQKQNMNFWDSSTSAAGITTKTLLWENPVVWGDTVVMIKLSASFHSRPDPPQVLLKFYVTVAASTARRRQHVPCAPKSVNRDVNKYVREFKSMPISTVNENSNEKNVCGCVCEGVYVWARKNTTSVILGEHNAIFDLMPTYTHTNTH